MLHCASNGGLRKCDGAQMNTNDWIKPGPEAASA